MQKIVTHLWYDKEAVEAAEFYTSVFPNSKINYKTTIHNTPSGDCDILSIEIMGQEFMLISAGPYFKFNPSVSFLVSCKTKTEVDELWGKLSVGGAALMELGEYPFSKWYGWTQDKYGLSWQIMLSDQEIKQVIVPTMMFVGDQCGRAEEAITFYNSVFRNSSVGHVMRYNEGEEPDKAGTIRHAGFTLEGQEFAAMDSAQEHTFAFNEAISFIVRCEDQTEIDYYWEKLSADPKAEQCGWLKDKFGFSWQIEPTAMQKIMQDKDQARVDRVTQAFLKMKKFDIAELEKAYEGK
ncbi:MAG TPA: VOC family protein [Vitreimonas sp.]|nr:VOC family protein [Vitreimonas sp.]